MTSIKALVIESLSVKYSKRSVMLNFRDCAF